VPVELVDGQISRENRPGFVRDTIQAIESMRATRDEKAMICEGNARRMLRIGPR